METLKDGTIDKSTDKYNKRMALTYIADSNDVEILAFNPKNMAFLHENLQVLKENTL